MPLSAWHHEAGAVHSHTETLGCQAFVITLIRQACQHKFLFQMQGILQNARITIIQIYQENHGL